MHNDNRKQEALRQREVACRTVITSSEVIHGYSSVSLIRQRLLLVKPFYSFNFSLRVYRLDKSNGNYYNYHACLLNVYASIASGLMILFFSCNVIAGCS